MLNTVSEILANEHNRFMSVFFQFTHARMTHVADDRSIEVVTENAQRNLKETPFL